MALMTAAACLYEVLALLWGEGAATGRTNHFIGIAFFMIVAWLIVYYLLGHYEDLYKKTQEEIADRERAEEALRQVPTMLEKQVAERTVELARINTELEREISERKRAEAELLASKAKLQLITDQMPGMVWTTDRDLRLTEIAGAGYSGLRIDTATFLGKRLHRIFRDGKQCGDRLLTHVVALEGRSGRYEIGLRGHQFDVRVEPLHDGAGKVMGCIGIALDVTARKRLENAVEKAKDYAENLIETANVMIMELGLDGTINIFNEGAEQITGYAKSDLAGKNLLTQVLPHGEYNYVREKFKEWQDGKLLLPISFESVIFTKLAAERFISWQINEIRDQNKPVGAICFGIDITERVKAEREVASRNQELFALHRISEIILGTESIDEAYQAIIEEICLATGFPVGSIEIYDEDRQTMIVKGMTGISPRSGGNAETPLDETLSSIALKTHKPVIETAVLSKPEYAHGLVKELGIQTFVCLPMVVKDRFIGALVLAHPSTVEVGGNLLSLGSSLANELAVFTHRIQINEALKESEERYRKLVEHSPDAIMVQSDETIIFVNAAGIRLLGAASEEEVLGRSIFDFVHPDSVALVKERHGLLEAGADLPFVEEKYICLDGRIIDIEASTVNFSFYGKSAVLILIRDITDRKQAEEQIKASLKEKEVLLKEIHHRVKNNLQIVSSLLYLQSRKTSDDQVLCVLRESQTRVRSMALIHEKLYQCDDLANINLGDYIRSLTSYLLNSYGVASHMVKLKINVESAPLGLDRAIPCGLIINELVSNALKYAFPQGRRGEIFVNLLRDGDGKLVLTVKDDGVGLPEDLDIADTPSLGLQLVNTLVKQLDGTIEVGRKGGTEFKMILS
jgi:PAS domain S-box-containing protein